MCMTPNSFHEFISSFSPAHRVDTSYQDVSDPVVAEVAKEVKEAKEAKEVKEVKEEVGVGRADPVGKADQAG